MTGLKRLFFVLAALTACGEQSAGVQEGDLTTDAVSPIDAAVAPDLTGCPNPRWEEVLPGPGTRLVDIQGVGAKTLFGISCISCSNSKLLRSDGAGWTEENVAWLYPGRSRCMGSLWGSSLSNLYAVGKEYMPGQLVDAGAPLDAGVPPHLSLDDRGILIKRTASQWEEVKVPGVTGLAAIWGADAKNIFMVGRSTNAAGGMIQLMRYDGTAFKSWPISSTITFTAIWGSGPKDVYAVGKKGVVYHFNGTWWTRIAGPGDLGDKDLNAIWGRGPKEIWGVGDGIFRFDGKKWETHLGGSTPQYQGVWGIETGDVFAVGGQGGIKRHDGKEWSQMTVSKSLRLGPIWASGLDAFVAGSIGTSNSGSLLRLRCR